MNRTIRDKVVSMLHYANHSQRFRSEVVLTTHVINLIPNITIGLKVAQEYGGLTRHLGIIIFDFLDVKICTSSKRTKDGVEL